MVVQPFRQAVGAKEEGVPRLAGHCANLWVNELVTATKRLLKHVPARMGARFPFLDAAIAQQPSYMRVIVAELFDGPIFRGEIINAAVTDVAEIHPARREPAKAQCRFHAATLFVAV